MLIDAPGCNVVVLVLVLGSVAAAAAAVVVVAVVVVVVVEVVVSAVLVGGFLEERGEISSQSPGLGTTFSQSFDVYGGRS